MKDVRQKPTSVGVGIVTWICPQAQDPSTVPGMAGSLAWLGCREVDVDLAVRTPVRVIQERWSCINRCTNRDKV